MKKLTKILKDEGYQLLYLNFENGMLDIVAQNNSYTWVLTDYSVENHDLLGCIAGIKTRNEDAEKCLDKLKEKKIMYYGFDLYHTLINQGFRGLDLCIISSNHDYMYNEIK